MSERGEQEERARAREALVGTTIASRYVLRAVVGHGGMGAVYEAEDAVARTRVAIKFIDSEFATDERVVARFAREARAMNAVASEHIVSVLDAGTEGGRPYLVMELLRGEDLGQRLRRTRRVPLGEAMHVVAQVLKGLAKAHAAGIVHRDLKPDNVFLVGNAADSHFVKIVDFGVSKIERPRDKTTPLALTGRGTVLGTPFYMAPEQAQALPDVDARADLYSVGAILFECLSGRPPHTGETYEQVILSICMRDAPDLRAIDPKLPAPVASFVARALSRDRDERFRSAERMLAALHEVAPEEKTRVPLDSGPPETLASGGTAPLVAQERSRVVDARPVSNPALGVGTRIGGSGASDPALPVAPWASTPEVPREVHAPAQPAPVVSAIAPPPAPIRLAGERAPAGAESSARARRRAIALIVVTAIVATLTGIGV
ncbi:MAG TPA: serine/threonine-protein kinase, partial [Labilithrix sp.]|nr:serine/threonine-protein kinase [Labilithrix sp.]